MPTSPQPAPQQAKTLRVVAIGGGTGLSTLLRGLKRYVPAPIASRRATDSPARRQVESSDDRSPRSALQLTTGSSIPDNRRAQAPTSDHPCLIRDLAAIVTVTDDGGSSGRLREDFKILPPGDVRNCMVALSEDEHLLSKLFQYRFDQGDLEGHSFGNLMTQANESLGLSASQHIEKIMQHCGAGSAPIFDYALINTAPISPTLLERYASEGQLPIEADLDRIRALGVEPITGNFVHEGDVLRHDPDRVTEALLKLALEAGQ